MNYKIHIYQLIGTNKLAFSMSVILAIGLIIMASIEGGLDKTILYLLTMAACFLLSEFIYFTGKVSLKPWKITHPRQELLVTFGVVLAGIGLLIYWFLIIDQSHASQMTKTITMILRLLFIFPVFLLVYFLAIKKYKPLTIGIWSFKYWFISLPLIVLIGGVAYLGFPDGMIQEFTIQQFIFLGFLTAAIPEEIARTLFQSRLGRVIHHKGMAWFIVSFIWALQHIPLFAFKSNGDLYGATIGALGILPIGLLWGYLNERYRSIIPSVLIHGTNIWGLNNIF